MQSKTGARLGLEIAGDPAATINRINERPRRAISAYLIQDENGQPLTQRALRSRVDKARTLAKVDFQFRDLRAKAATDTGDLAHSQKLLAHKNREMTEHYGLGRQSFEASVTTCRHSWHTGTVNTIDTCRCAGRAGEKHPSRPGIGSGRAPSSHLPSSSKS